MRAVGLAGALLMGPAVGVSASAAEAIYSNSNPLINPNELSFHELYAGYLLFNRTSTIKNHLADGEKIPSSEYRDRLLQSSYDGKEHVSAFLRAETVLKKKFGDQWKLRAVLCSTEPRQKYQDSLRRELTRFFEGNPYNRKDLDIVMRKLLERDAPLYLALRHLEREGQQLGMNPNAAACNVGVAAFGARLLPVLRWNN